MPYFLARLLGRLVWFFPINARVTGAENLNQGGGYLLASNHFHHLDPLLLSIHHHRPIDWMTRIEFFKWPPIACLIRLLGGFAVNRQGVPVSAIRMAMARLDAGRVVGICPEGGVVSRSDSVCYGAPIKQGACLIACRSGAPIIPCLIIGSRKLNHLRPWLPFRRAHLWIAFGQPLYPPTNIIHRKAARKAMSEQLQLQFMQLHERTVGLFNIAPIDRD